jgi:hypothetical protein
MATPDRFSAADWRWQRLAPGLIVATDTVFMDELAKKAGKDPAR